MKQSIIAVIITAIVGVCGGSLGLKPPTGGNLTTTSAGEQVTNIVAQTTQQTTSKLTKPQQTTNCNTIQKPTGVVQETTGQQATTNISISLPQETSGIQTTAEIQTTKHPQNTVEIQTTKHPQNTVEIQTTKRPQNTGNVSTTKPQQTTGVQTTKPENNQNKSFARQVVDLVNKERNKAGLNSLSIDTKIESAAMVRSKKIEKSFSHTRPDGSSFSTVLSESGVSFRGAGENIAWGQKSPEEVMNGWMNSSGHRANILYSNFKNIGVAYYVGSNGRTYWTQLFTY